MRFLVLYEEMATYFLKCLEHLATNYNCEILVFTKKVNSVAPFIFKDYHKNVTIIERDQLSEEELKNKCIEFRPDFVYLSGWIHQPYMKLIKQAKFKNVIIGFDNQYNGSIKQLVGSVYFKLTLKPYIKAAFVPGLKQVVFAKLLGFKEGCISKNVYCCDLDLYHNYYINTKEKEASLPKRFLFVGRYVNEKGIKDLWESFVQMQEESPNEWELWCVGKGEIAPVNHPKIKHFGFIQPENLYEIIKGTSVFVLPSTFEPWGVVIHEYAAAGFPIICSEKVGASEIFIEPGKNGYLIDPENKKQLKDTLKKFVSLSETELKNMSNQSHRISKKITPEIWCQSLLQLVNV